MDWSIWIGFDPRPMEATAFAVARSSIRSRLTAPIPIYGVCLQDLRERGLYTRQHEIHTNANGKEQLWDVISGAPMATEFAISRFLVPHLAGQGWALFLDCDMLARENLARVFEQFTNKKYAVVCVKHKHRPENSIKMDGQVQTQYPRKNWSSLMLFNCAHPANKKLTVELINSVPGRDLHRFCWLEDDEIGELGVEWNCLVGHSPDQAPAKIVHFTDGTPNMPGYEDSAYADEWRRELLRWAA